MVVAANKADLHDTMSESEIRKRLNLSREVPIYFISATRKADVRFVLESLVDVISKSKH
jgi:signal recognition particle receptor subunit beta